MPSLTLPAATIFAPVDSGGNARGASMSEVQTWGQEVEQWLLSISSNDITAFGAVGDGLDASLTTNSAAIQAAIDSLPSTGGVVYVPPGVYVCQDIKINGTARNKARVLLFGTPHSHLRLPNGAGAVNLIDMNGAVECGVYRLLLNGNRANITVPTLTDGPDYEKRNVVFMQATTECFVLDCVVANAPVIGIMPGSAWCDIGDLPGSPLGGTRNRVIGNTVKNCNVGIAGMRMYQCLITDNLITDSVTYGAVLDQLTAYTEFTDNTLQGAGADAVYVYRASFNDVSSNTITLVSTTGISVDDDSDGNLISDNVVTSTGNTAIVITDGSDKNIVSGNKISSAGQWGVASIVGQSSAGAYNSIIGNKIDTCAYGGIAGISSAVLSIKGNDIQSCAGSGIYVEGAGMAGSEIKNNTCVNNSTGSIVDAGIRLKTATDILILDNTCRDHQGTKTQKWGIRADESCTNLTIRRNALAGNLTAPLVISGTGHKVTNNEAWVTEAGGTTSITYPSATSVTVTHGCSYTPLAQDITITLAGGLTSGNNFGVDTITSTTFRLFLTQTPASGTYYFSWRVQSI